MSYNIILLGNMQVAETQLVADLYDERGRGFASTKEAWAQLKENLEKIEAGVKQLKDLHKEMWPAVKENNQNAFAALANEFQRVGVSTAGEVTTASAMADMALCKMEE